MAFGSLVGTLRAGASSSRPRVEDERAARLGRQLRVVDHHAAAAAMWRHRRTVRAASVSTADRHDRPTGVDIDPAAADPVDARHEIGGCVRCRPSGLLGTGPDKGPRTGRRPLQWEPSRTSEDTPRRGVPAIAPGNARETRSARSRDRRTAWPARGRACPAPADYGADQAARTNSRRGCKSSGR